MTSVTGMRRVSGELVQVRDATGLLGFEPRSEAPEASVLSKLDYRPFAVETRRLNKPFRRTYPGFWPRWITKAP